MGMEGIKINKLDIVVDPRKKLTCTVVLVSTTSITSIVSQISNKAINTYNTKRNTAFNTYIGNRCEIQGKRRKKKVRERTRRS